MPQSTNPQHPQLPTKPEPTDPSISPVDAAALQALTGIAVSALENWSEATKYASEAQRDTAKINAEWREKESAHELRLAEISSKEEAAKDERRAKWLLVREDTIRALGGLTLLGLLGFIFYALSLGKVEDPVDAFTKLIGAGSFVWLLVKQTGTTGTKEPPKDDDE